MGNRDMIHTHCKACDTISNFYADLFEFAGCILVTFSNLQPMQSPSVYTHIPLGWSEQESLGITVIVKITITVVGTLVIFIKPADILWVYRLAYHLGEVVIILLVSCVGNRIISGSLGWSVSHNIKLLTVFTSWYIDSWGQRGHSCWRSTTKRWRRWRSSIRGWDMGG